MVSDGIAVLRAVEASRPQLFAAVQVEHAEDPWGRAPLKDGVARADCFSGHPDPEGPALGSPRAHHRHLRNRIAFVFRGQPPQLQHA